MFTHARRGKMTQFIRFLQNSLFCVRVVRVSFFSTTAPRPSCFSLLSRISAINDPKASIIPVLEKWVDEGKSVTNQELQSCIGTMRKFKRFLHALEISQWMTDRRYFSLTSSDVAVRLKLIYNVHGLQHAEKYFNNTSKQFKVAQTYGALLDCYVNEKATDKAEAVMQEMRRKGFVESTFSFNLLTSLYAQMGQQKKIDMLITEMREMGIPQDKYTLTNQLACYIAVPDIERMENILKLMAGSSVLVDWNFYAVAARGYLKVGLFDKALEMLRKVEEMTMRSRTARVLDHLLTLYASAGKKDDVYRIWELYKSTQRVRKSSHSRAASYVCMISSLGKLDDFVGAKKIWEEWDSKHGSYDSRVLNQLVSVYCKQLLFEKAEELVQQVVQKAADSGGSLYASTWNIIAMGYLSDKQMVKGVEMLKKAFSAGRERWKPSDASIKSCLEYFEVQRDAEAADEFIESLGPLGLLTRDVYHWMLRIYISANKPVSHVLALMKADGFSADEETHRILPGVES